MSPPERGTLSPTDFGRVFRTFLEEVVHRAPRDDPPLLVRLREHLGVEPQSLPVVAHRFSETHHANLQVALDAVLAREGRAAEPVGVHAEFMGPRGIGLTDLASPPSRQGVSPARPGPLSYRNFELEAGEVMPCLTSALLLVRDGDRPLAAMVSRPEYEGGVALESMALTREESERFLAEVRREMRERSVFRGKVLSLVPNPQGRPRPKFHSLPRVDRDRIVLPEGTLERVERHATGFVRHRDRLLAAGRHLKRGLLLHGPPGTGKTLTAMHLVGSMPGRTVVMLTGASLRFIETAGGIARDLQPSTVIVEDVDLVGEERTSEHATPPLLFELLNQMDGLAEDADVLFILTTNRPDLLEPALAARPGRIDQAVRLSLPDRDGRRRLIELYADGLELGASDLDGMAERTEGASPALIRELLRKAALLAAEEADGRMTVEDRHLEGALRDLQGEGGALTRTLLGARPAEPSVPNEPSGPAV